MNIEATVSGDTLSLNVGDHGITVTPPTDVEAINSGIDVLMGALAGVTKHELMMAAFYATEGAPQ